MRVGFVGLGAMGGPMAAALLDAGHAVTGFDLSDRALKRLEDAGGTRAEAVRDACEDADALVLMVVNAAQVRAVLLDGGALEALPAGALVLSCVTMPPEEAVRIGEVATASGRPYLDAPVSGGTVGARDASLTFMASGTAEAFAAARPLMEAMGRNVFECGDAPGQGSTMKTVHQLAAGCNLAVAAEVMSFGTHLGLDPQRILDVLNVSAGGSWMIGNRGPRMLTEGEEASSAVDIFVKDLGIVLDSARASRFPVPVSAAALQVFLGASGVGFGSHDDSQATRFYEAMGGRKVRRGT